MPKSYWTRIRTPDGPKYFRADDVTDELLQKIKDEVDGVFYVVYGTTTYSDALAAYNAGKSVLLLKTSGALTYIYKLVSASSTALRFSKVDGQLQDTVALNSADQYSDTHTTLAKTDNVMKTASAEIAPEYYDLCIEYQTEHKFPIPAGTVVTYFDNTSSDVLQYLYKSKVEIDENDYASSDPIAAPAKWDKVHVSDELKRLKNEQPVLTYSFSNDSYPSGADIWNAVSTGHIPMLKRTQMYVTRIYMMAQYGSHGNERDIYFYSFQNCNILRLHTSNGTTWTWTSSDMYDSSLSSTGTNAVQNKTLYGLINDLQTRVAALEGN